MKILLGIIMHIMFVASSVVMHENDVHMPALVTEEEQAFSSDGLRDGNDISRDGATAFLTDAHDVYRICNSRPQRLLPTLGFKQERTTGKPFSLFYCKSNKYKRSCRWALRITLPIRTVVSCDYYVFTLRRLLC